MTSLRDRLDRIERKLDTVLANLPLLQRAAGDVAVRVEAERQAAKWKDGLARLSAEGPGRRIVAGQANALTERSG